MSRNCLAEEAQHKNTAVKIEQLPIIVFNSYRAYGF